MFEYKFKSLIVELANLKAEIRYLKAERDALEIGVSALKCELSARDEHLNTIEASKVLTLFQERLDEFEAGIKELKQELSRS